MRHAITYTEELQGAGEGWFIGVEGTIKRILFSSFAIFGNDEQAFEFVAAKAKEGSELHRKVIAELVARRMTR